jgi:hypothetical protein
VPFKGSSRLRIRVALEANALVALGAHLKSRSDVVQVRVNRLAGSCVILFDPSSRTDFDHWLTQLPHERDLGELGGTLSQANGSSAPASSQGTGEASGDGEDEEPFVPTRIVLPVASLGLALLAGPLALPPWPLRPSSWWLPS